MAPAHPDAGDAARVVRVTCPNPACKISLKTRAKNIGRRVLCPKCKTSVWVPSGPAPVATHRPSPLPRAPVTVRDEDLYELDAPDAPTDRSHERAFRLMIAGSLAVFFLFVVSATAIVLWYANRETTTASTTDSERRLSSGEASRKAKNDAPPARSKPDVDTGAKKETLPASELGPRETPPSTPKETPPAQATPPRETLPAHSGQNSPETKPKEETPAVPKSPPPQDDTPPSSLPLAPTLPQMPGNLGWKKEAQEELDKALANYPRDQVSAHLAFRKLLTQDPKSLTVPQRQWLQKATDATLDRSLAVLKQDFTNAEKSSDLHTMHLCLLVANLIRKDSLAEQRAAFATAQRQVSAGQRSITPVWKITQVRGRLLRTFSDGTFYPITLTPKKGDTLLRVTARIENISTTPDLPYASTALRFGDTNSRKDQITGPARIIQDDFLFVLHDDQGSRPCEYVCENCKALRGFTVSGQDNKTGKVLVIPGGTYVARGEGFDLDVVFSMPKDSVNPRLLVMGSTPIPIDVPGATPQTRVGQPQTSDTGDRAKLQGTWKLVEIRWAEPSGTASFMLTSKHYLTIKDDELMERNEHSDGKVTQTKYKLELDTSKKPPVYKQTALDGETKGKSTSGIYALSGDNLQMCTLKNGLPRDLTIVQGQDVKDKYLYIYQREKP